MGRDALTVCAAVCVGDCVTPERVGLQRKQAPLSEVGCMTRHTEQPHLALPVTVDDGGLLGVSEPDAGDTDGVCTISMTMNHMYVTGVGHVWFGSSQGRQP
jgi:hypothetical protein